MWPPLRQVDVLDIPVLSTKVKVVESARPHRSLGVIFDNQLSLSTHVTALCQSGYSQLRQLRPVDQSLTTEAAKTMIQAFICCRFDYCNSLLYGASDGLIQKLALQSVQNSAARLITGARRCDHIMHVLVELHWLPVRRRMEYKVACLVHQSLSGQAPAYLTDDINLVAVMAVAFSDPQLTGLASYHAPKFVVSLMAVTDHSMRLFWLKILLLSYLHKSDLHSLSLLT